MPSDAAALFGPGFFETWPDLAKTPFVRSLFWPESLTVDNLNDNLRGQVGGVIEATRSPPTLVNLSTTGETFADEFRKLFVASALDSRPDQPTFATGATRYSFLSKEPVGACLMVGRFFQPGLAEGEEASWSPPTLFLVNMPSITPRGEAIDARSVWPQASVSTPVQLRPGGIPRPAGLFRPVVASLHASSLRDDTLQSRDAYYTHGSVVVLLDGERLAGWVGVPSQATPEEASSWEEALTCPLWGSHGTLTVATGGQMTWVPIDPEHAPAPVRACLPRVLFLPPCHGLPVSKMEYIFVDGIKKTISRISRPTFE